MDTEVAVLEPGETFTDAVLVPRVAEPDEQLAPVYQESEDEGLALGRLKLAIVNLTRTLDEMQRISLTSIRRSVYKELPNLANDIRLAAIDVSRIGQPVRVTAPTPEGEPVKRRGRPKKAAE